MHARAYQFIAKMRERFIPKDATFSERRSLRVLEIGSYNVNGTVRTLFPQTCDYVGIDRVPGKGVDIVADGATYDSDQKFNVVICCEAFEHTDNWREVVANSARVISGQGVFVGTCAGPGRKEHSCLAGPLRPGEYYANVDPEELKACLVQYFSEVEVYFVGDDVQWFCRK